jgi:geranylgeranyl reductase family protein
MDACEVLIVGGGPAGSTCAWKLRSRGLDVAVIDAANFPRDKVCAGWITPQVVEDLEIDPSEYGAGRTWQPITSFRVGSIGVDDPVDVAYDRAVSFGIRRCEFDDYLLRRSKARLLLGSRVSRIRRRGTKWIVNETIEAAMLVGAGGYHCPVARMLSGAGDGRPTVVAQEAEVSLDRDAFSESAVRPERPELYFCDDLGGYGWCFRKGDYLNVGFGRVDARALPDARAQFVDFLMRAGVLPRRATWPWRGHAYRVGGALPPRPVDDGVLLIGDAAGLAYPQSGEGIRPAVESGLMAASTIRQASGRYERDRLASYVDRLQEQYFGGAVGGLSSRLIPRRVCAAFADYGLRNAFIARRLVLDRWFLRSREPALIASQRASSLL